MFTAIPAVNIPERLMSLRCPQGAKILFARSDSAAGAYIGTSAAIHAGVGIDAVLFAFADSAAGAFVDAGAAGNAVVTDYISHSRECFKG